MISPQQQQNQQQNQMITPQQQQYQPQNEVNPSQPPQYQQQNQVIPPQQHQYQYQQPHPNPLQYQYQQQQSSESGSTFAVHESASMNDDNLSQGMIIDKLTRLQQSTEDKFAKLSKSHATGQKTLYDKLDAMNTINEEKINKSINDALSKNEVLQNLQKEQQHRHQQQEIQQHEHQIQQNETLPHQHQQQQNEIAKGIPDRFLITDINLYG